MKTLIVLDVFVTSCEAHLVKTFLESHGIKVLLKDLHIIDTEPLASFAFGGIKLQVRQNDFPLAEKLYYSTFKKSRKKNICPRCDSNLTLPIINGYSKFVRILYLSLHRLFPFWLSLYYHCFDCDKEFKT